jgi:putative endopeptidase
MRAGIERAYVDPDVRVQDDLFRHVNGRWLDTYEMPADRAADGAFRTLHDRAEEDLRAIIEAAAAAAADGTATEEQRKIGELYASFMDVEAVERRGVEPIADDLAAIAATEDLEGFLALLGRLQRQGVGGAFGLWVDTDATQSDRYIVNLVQAGIGLPDESYFREDAFAELRAAYAEHVTRMLTLAGPDLVPDPGGAAARAIALETRLAAAHWDRVESRDETKTTNKLDRAAVRALLEKAW